MVLSRVNNFFFNNIEGHGSEAGFIEHFALFFESS